MPQEDPNIAEIEAFLGAIAPALRTVKKPKTYSSGAKILQAIQQSGKTKAVRPWSYKNGIKALVKAFQLIEESKKEGLYSDTLTVSPPDKAEISPSTETKEVNLSTSQAPPEGRNCDPS